MSPSAISNGENTVVETEEKPNGQLKNHNKYSMLPRTLHEAPLMVTHAKGNYIFLEDGRKIFDASSGAAAAAIGHGDERIKEAVMRQMDQLCYANTTAFTNRPGEELAKILIDSTDGAMSKVFFVGSGSEAMEAALKLARQYFLETDPPQPQRTKFISRDGSYHGISIGALSVSGHVARRALFEPILGMDTSRVDSCNKYRGPKPGESDEAYVSRLANQLDDEFQRVGSDTVCAFVMEPVVGAALGCVPALLGYIKAIKQVCQKHGALLILDEVMCGTGRSGTQHSWEQDGIVPDLQTIGKNLGAGYVPLAALLIGDKVVQTLDRGTGSFIHGHTFQGHPVACASAIEVQRIIKEENLIQNAARMGALLSDKLVQGLKDHPNVGDIRGRGLFWGIEFVADKATKEPFPPEDKVAFGIQDLGMTPEFAIAIYPGQGTVDGKRGDHIIVSPAFNVDEEDVSHVANTICSVIERYFKDKTR